jgi:NAD(P)-dependent dehydrogenase (short-subunit alcohol dehydrogenase family)
MEENTYLITGATSGIGKSISLALADKKAKLFLIVRDIEKYNQVFNGYNNCTPILLDLAEVNNIEFVLKSKIDCKLSGVVLAAGIEETFPIKLYSPKKIKSFFDINFFSNFEILRIVTGKKYINNNSSLVIMSSVMSELGQPGKTAYCATKAAIIGLVNSLSLELSSRKIRVNAVSPGVVKTPMTDKLFSQLDENQIENITNMHPIGIGSVEDVTELILFLLSAKSKWITGQNLKIDGGYSIQ